MPHANREVHLEYHRQYNKEHRAEQSRGRQLRRRSAHQKYREAALARLGNKCVRCGFDDVRALQIDHVNGNGPSDRKRFSGTYTFYKYVAESENPFTEYQLLCANCNWIKRCENREYQSRRVN